MPDEMGSVYGGFSCGMEVEPLEIHCLPGFVKFLSSYYHVVHPSLLGPTDGMVSYHTCSTLPVT